MGAPAGCRIIAMTPLGYPKAPDLIHPVSESKRKKPEEVFCYERYA